MRYVILAKGGHKGFDIPRQLSVINGERLLDRTIRQLRENGIDDIYVTGDYTDINAKVVNPEGNTYEYDTDKGYWLDAFQGFLDAPTCFIWGDVFFSDYAIETIVNNETKSTLMFGTDIRRYKSNDYIKNHDEPFAYKVEDIKLFKKHIEKVKKMYDKGLCIRHPIVWELYRSINGYDVNKHIIEKNYISINDITCDIDKPEDVIKINFMLGVGKMVRLIVCSSFTIGEKQYKWDDISNIVRADPQNDRIGELNPGDTFTCSNEMAKYLVGCNKPGTTYVEVSEVISEEKKEAKKEEAEEKPKRRTRKTK